MSRDTVLLPAAMFMSTSHSSLLENTSAHYGRPFDVRQSRRETGFVLLTQNQSQFEPGFSIVVF